MNCGNLKQAKDINHSVDDTHVAKKVIESSRIGDSG